MADKEDHIKQEAAPQQAAPQQPHDEAATPAEGGAHAAGTEGDANATANATANADAGQQGADGGHSPHEPSTLDMLKQSVSEDDPKPSPTLTLRKILGGDILAATLVRSQIWLLVLIMLITVVYVAFRYQCQQDFITIDRLEGELKDAKYKALSISSALTERSRESRILEMLKANEDSLLAPSDQPPYIIQIPEQ